MSHGRTVSDDCNRNAPVAIMYFTLSATGAFCGFVSVNYSLFFSQPFFVLAYVYAASGKKDKCAYEQYCMKGVLKECFGGAQHCYERGKLQSEKYSCIHVVAVYIIQNSSI